MVVRPVQRLILVYLFLFLWFCFLSEVNFVCVDSCISSLVIRPVTLRSLPVVLVLQRADYPVAGSQHDRISPMGGLGMVATFARGLALAAWFSANIHGALAPLVRRYAVLERCTLQQLVLFLGIGIFAPRVPDLGHNARHCAESGLDLLVVGGCGQRLGIERNGALAILHLDGSRYRLDRLALQWPLARYE